MLRGAGRVRVIVITTAAVNAAIGGYAGFGRLALVAQVAIAPQNPSQTQPVTSRGTGILLGQVVDGSSSKPVDGATVVLSGGNPVEAPPGGPRPSPAATSAPRQIITDASGRFLFHDLAKGRYSIRAFATGYLGGTYGQNRPTGSSQSIDLATDEEKRGDLTVRLWKSASITGTVFDERGEPIVDKTIRLFRRTMSAGRPFYSPASSKWTDDRGVYRFADLAPGSYLVAMVSTQVTMPSATQDAFIQQMMAGGNNPTSDVIRELSSSGAPSGLLGGYRVGGFIFQTGSSDHASGTSPAPAPADESRILIYPTVFFPAAATSAQATVIELGSGEDRTGIDLQLKLSPTVRVSGVVVGPDGPASNLGVKLFAADLDDVLADTNVETASTVTDAKGAFTFLGLTPGQYTLKCLRMPRPLPVTGPSSPPLPAEQTLWATQPVGVAEADITGVSVTLRPGARISGKFVFSGTQDPPSPEQLARAQFDLSPTSGAEAIQFLTAARRVELDGRFAAVGYPPGRYVVSASVPVAGPGGTPWSMTSVKLGAKEVSDEGLEISSDDIANLVITFSDRTTQLSGTVRDTKGEVDGEAAVIIIPADSDAWKHGNIHARRLRNARTGTNGGYIVSNLLPGAYFIAAVKDEILRDWQDPKVLNAIAAVATRITLGDAEKKTQDLTTQNIR